MNKEEFNKLKDLLKKKTKRELNLKKNQYQNKKIYKINNLNQKRNKGKKRSIIGWSMKRLQKRNQLYKTNNKVMIKIQKLIWRRNKYKLKKI